MSSSKKYVPPSKRTQMNKFEILDEPEEEVEKKVEEEFPSLVAQTTTAKPKQWEGKRKFSELAIQADLRAKDEKYREEIEKSMQKYNNYNHYLPKFDNVGRFIEPEDEQYQPVEERLVEEDDGWTTVKNSKSRKAKNIEEIANRPPTPEEKPSANEEFQEDSYWDQP